MDAAIKRRAANPDRVPREFDSRALYKMPKGT